MSTAAASEVFDVHVIEPPRPTRALRRAAVAAVNVLFEGQGPTSAGGRRAVVTERSTGHRVGEYTEPAGDDGTSDFALMLADHQSADAEYFREQWVGPPMSVD